MLIHLHVQFFVYVGEWIFLYEILHKDIILSLKIEHSEKKNIKMEIKKKHKTRLVSQCLFLLFIHVIL